MGAERRRPAPSRRDTGPRDQPAKQRRQNRATYRRRSQPRERSLNGGKAVTVRCVDSEVVAALVGVPVAAAVGWAGWRLGVAQTDAAARSEALGQYRWAVEQIGSPTAGTRAAGWVVLQTLVEDPSLTAADRRMIGATAHKLRTAAGGGT